MMEASIPQQATQSAGQAASGTNDELKSAFDQALIAGAMSVGTLLMGDNIKELSKEMEE